MVDDSNQNESDESVDSEDEITSSDSNSKSGEKQSKAVDEKFCSSCGVTIKKEAAICPECGVEQGSSNDNGPGVAALLSGIGFIIPIAAGAGQIYNGQIGKGIALSVIQMFNVFLFFVLIGFVTYPLVGIYAVYDAYNGAQ